VTGPGKTLKRDGSGAGYIRFNRQFTLFFQGWPYRFQVSSARNTVYSRGESLFETGLVLVFVP